MKACLDQSIKDLIRAHPGLGNLLNASGIGCVSCGLGTCKVREILEVHNLDAGQSVDLLTRMGREIYGEAPFEVPAIARRAAPERSAFCPPIARMVEEHRNILALLGALPALAEALGKDFVATRPLAEAALDFIRNYADRYHHAKEEDILFGYFDGESPILQAMLGDHEAGRAHVRAAAQALAEGDAEGFAARMAQYAELLRGHIQREDGILYPWMDRTLTMAQVGELFARCAEVDARFGEGPARHAAFAQGLAGRLG